jgi:hypothetical protein
MNSPVRTSAIRLLQHLQLLYLPSELDITKYTKRVYPTFDCNQTPDPVLPTGKDSAELARNVDEGRCWSDGKHPSASDDGYFADGMSSHFLKYRCISLYRRPAEP